MNEKQRYELCMYDNIYNNIDIEEDGINSIIRVNEKDIDTKTRKDIAIGLRSKIPEIRYAFKKDIAINQDEKLEIKVLEDNIDLEKIDTINIGGIQIKKLRFKNSYKNINLIYWKNPYENMEYRMEYILREGYRHLSLEESHHAIDLIFPPENVPLNLYVDFSKKEC